MCGIFGIVAHGARVPTDVLERGTTSLAHRGPDDSGTIVIRDGDDVEVGLGNRRLAILDLSPLGHQPMHDLETGNWIVYNGEIYNFRDVRAELEHAGTKFVSHSDTEVLLKAYARWGEQCLARLRGMFAFALWDARRHRLFVARDPMGIKPLYFAEAKGYLVFASEVRSILGTGLIPRKLDPVGVRNYLSFGSACDPGTVIEGVQALPAGHFMIWERGQLGQQQYWDLVDNHPDGPFELPAELERVVQMQTVSDVPLGVFLSGGIDSGALVSILARAGIRPSTFSIVFKEADFSEAQFSRAVAQKFKTDHHEITVSQNDVLASIPAAMSAMDLPSIDAVNTFFVSRETRAAGIKVALSGLGGDEVFAGYSNFRTVPRMERLSKFLNYVPNGARAPMAAALGTVLWKNDQNRKLQALVRENGRIPHPYFLARMLFTPEQVSELIRSGSSYSDSTAQSDLVQKALRLDPVNRVSYLESRHYMLNTLLRDADFMSMSQGLEVRVPLIDHQLAKKVLALPGEKKISNSTPKPLLVSALQDPLPDEIVHRQKRGFTLPFEHWLRAELRAEIEPVLKRRISEGPLASVLIAHGAETVWQDFLRGETSWTRPWALYVLHQWCERNAVNG